MRRLKTQAATPSPPLSPKPTSAEDSFSASSAATATATATEIVPWGREDANAVDADPRREEARRFARLVATDIRLYNEEAVVVGRRERDLASRLGEQLKRGRDTFSHRFPDLGPDGTKLLDDAYVQVLAGGDTSLI